MISLKKTTTVLGIILILFCIVTVIFISDIVDLDSRARSWSESNFDGAKNYIDTAYSEIKGISIQLLSLLAGILIFSITFSEKVVKYESASKLARWALISGWTCFIVAIIFDGFGLAFNALALANGLFDSNSNSTYGSLTNVGYILPAVRALFLIIISGFFFVIGLIFVVSAGVISYRKA